MVGGRKYKTEQIRFVLEMKSNGHSAAEIQREYQRRFNDPTFGPSQLKYIRQYANHPEFQ